MKRALRESCSSKRSPCDAEEGKIDLISSRTRRLGLLSARHERRQPDVDRHADGDAGPPFSVPDEEIERLMAPNFRIERLAHLPADARGRSESIWALERRGPRV